MQSISSDDDGTYASHMPPSRPVCLVCHAGHDYFVVAILGFVCCHICISGYAPPFLMRIFALDLNGNCPGGAKSRFTASESWRSTPKYYPPSDYELEWLYLLRSAKLCAVHNAQSGPLTGAKNLCAVAALPAAQHTYYVSKTPLLAVGN
jgi:hypothetical protein